MIWDDPEAKKDKKIKKTTKNAVKAVGGGVALWFFSLIYPQHEGSETVANLLFDLSLVLVLYGGVILGFVGFMRDRALLVNSLMTWLIVPSYVIYLLLKASSGGG